MVFLVLSFFATLMQQEKSVIIEEKYFNYTLSICLIHSFQSSIFIYNDTDYLSSSFKSHCIFVYAKSFLMSLILQRKRFNLDPKRVAYKMNFSPVAILHFSRLVCYNLSTFYIPVFHYR